MDDYRAGGAPLGRLQLDIGDGSPAEDRQHVVAALESVSYIYPNGLIAVADATFDVHRGEIVSIVGPSGCGKSTILRILAGLARPETGTLRRSSVKGVHPCSMMFQEDTVLPWLRVRKNVQLHAKFTHKRGPSVAKHVDELLRMGGLSEFASFWPAQLSGGMRRRVAMLTAIAARPELLLLDEPFSALDEPTRVALHQDIHRLIREFGISAVLVTHDLGEAITLADRIILLSGSPARVVDQYEIPFGASREIELLRTDSRFLKLYGKLWEKLGTQIKSGSKTGA